MLSQMSGFRFSTSVMTWISSAVITLLMTFEPVHKISIAGTSFWPMVLRYSDSVTVGTARVLQYCVGQKRKFGELG